MSTPTSTPVPTAPDSGLVAAAPAAGLADTAPAAAPASAAPASAEGRTRFATLPPHARTTSPLPSVRRRGGPRRRLPLRVFALAVVLTGCVALVVAGALGGTGAPKSADGITLPVALTVSVFVLAVWAWSATDLDDTLVAFLAALALIAVGVLPVEDFFASLGDETIWLLIGAFVMATAISSSGLALRAAAHLVRFARGPRSLFHLTTVALTLSAFAVPATSGRAALAVPVHAALSTALDGRPRVVRALALLMPTVVLLSAVGSLLGAGAHLITDQLLRASGEQGFTFLTWLWLGLPLAVVSSHLACELILWRFLARADRARGVRVTPADIERASGLRVTGPLTGLERRATLLLGAAVLLWSTEPLHGLPPALVALLGAVAAVTPGIGCTTLPTAVARVPWSLLLFLAATLALAAALTGSGAAEWLSTSALEPLRGLGAAGAVGFLLVVVAVSTAAHLLIPSRSARSAAIVPAVIALAPGLGVEPMAAALASTAAAGFCHTLPSSAKPVAMFADPQVVQGGFDRGDLRRLSVVLAPAMFVLVAVFALWIWPLQGLPLLR
ncbi:SLC13 family permease [Microbacterium sp. p3-SID336]|uniref:SLC13 family permease n=1 Tax=Microbacterium sp. p3-SID336 TaxID=2916212 RepID=UPI0021A5E31D|nr:SLC13 family permease [Microbacterium sp. p3-SID336]MCT1478808.1 SLC13 family permease [Microbacterium sp. p3-SID336]